MIDLRLLRENPGNYKAGAKAKNIPVDIDRILALDEDKRRLLTRIEHLRAEQNKIAKR